MRAALVALALVLSLVALAPAPAQAQAPRIEVEPFPTLPVLTGRVARNVTLAWPCEAGEAVVWVEDAPAWLEAGARPDRLALPAACAGEAQLATELVLEALDEAPAHRPTNVTLAASSAQGANLTVRALVPIVVAYYSFIDVAQEATAKDARPGERVTFGILVTSYANGETRLATTLVEATPGLHVELPEEARVGSLHQGSTDLQADLTVAVRAPPRGAPPANVTVRVTSYDAVTGAVGENATLALTVASRLDEQTPLPPWVALGGFAAAAAIRRSLRPSGPPAR